MRFLRFICGVIKEGETSVRHPATVFDLETLTPTTYVRIKDAAERHQRWKDNLYHPGWSHNVDRTFTTLTAATSRTV